MTWNATVLLAGAAIGAIAFPVGAQTGGAASIEQIGRPTANAAHVDPVPKSRSSATAQNAMADKVPPAVSPETLAACQRAQQDDRAAPPDLDCVKALQVTATRDQTSAEGALLPLFGQRGAVTTQAAVDAGQSTSADQVSRQLSSGDFQGTVGSDAAASVARDRPPPATTPPPR